MIEQKKQWEWLNCHFDLKQTVDNNDIYINLQPNVCLNYENEELDINLKIQLDRDFIQTDNGWNWHKSWNIPIIKVNIDFYERKMNKYFSPPNPYYAVVQAVKPILSNSKRFHLYDVGIQGQNQLPLKDLTCCFSQLKFTSTSYNHNDSMFHLIVSVYLKDELKNNDLLLACKMSPPILIDSRKLAREKQIIKERNISQFIEIFDPLLLQKNFIKKETRNSEQSHNDISNDLQGLFNYFTAANIREKVKHPLFMAIYFSNCIDLYVDPKKFDQTNKKLFVKKLMNFIKNAYKNVLEEHQEQIIDPKIILFIKNSRLTDKKQIQKIMDAYQVLKNGIISIVSKKTYVPDTFELVQDINVIHETYIEMKPSIDQYLNKNKSQSHSDKDDEQLDELFQEQKSQNHTEIQLYPFEKLNPQKKLFLEQIKEQSKGHQQIQQNEQQSHYKSKIDVQMTQPQQSSKLNYYQQEFINQQQNYQVQQFYEKILLFNQQKSKPYLLSQGLFNQSIKQ